MLEVKSETTELFAEIFWRCRRKRKYHFLLRQLRRQYIVFSAKPERVERGVDRVHGRAEKCVAENIHRKHYIVLPGAPPS